MVSKRSVKHPDNPQRQALFPIILQIAVEIFKKVFVTFVFAQFVLQNGFNGAILLQF